ncbi:MAG: hypothetical protein R3A10_14455 [Caldilineaceae bacterium]
MSTKARCSLLADEEHHINKHKFTVPLSAAAATWARRCAGSKAAAMIRTKGEAGTGNVVEAVRHARTVMGEIRRLQTMDEDEPFSYAKEIRAPTALVAETATGRMPVVNFVGRRRRHPRGRS